MKIMLNSIDRIRQFVNLTTECKGNIDLVSGRYMVDGKSIMGIFSLDLSKPIRVNMIGLDDSERMEFIEQLSKKHFDLLFEDERKNEKRIEQYLETTITRVS